LVSSVSMKIKRENQKSPPDLRKRPPRDDKSNRQTVAKNKLGPHSVKNNRSDARDDEKLLYLGCHLYEARLSLI
jgi:hypothetical protein